MALDFGKLWSENSAESVIPPREIFSVLPSKDTKYQYPRDVQAEVWQQWHDRRNENELVIKMNTGGGKTVVGLLILKSCLNEGVGPAVYVAPDPYLVSQVIGEATSLGLEVTDDPNSIRFQKGKAILIINIKKLINGRSVFGVGEEGPKIKIGSLIIDDAHACLATSEQQFTMEVKGTPYEELFGLFKGSLYEQSPSLALEVEQHEPYKEMRVPYWDWIEKERQVAKILFAHRSEEDIVWTWPLLKGHLKLCRCVFGKSTAEISPHVLPVSVIPSIAAAKRRIFMSATLADDSVLMSHFDLNAKAALKAISPSTANDIGDRMILLPQELNPTVTDEVLKRFAAELAKVHNVVVLVPSGYRALFWKNVAQDTLTSTNIEAGVKRLKEGHVGLVVIVNRYDGIDLPQNACRILIIDGLPDVRRMRDKIEESILQGSDVILTQRIQKIEQGMGRGVRSSDDFCVVFLMGRTLTNFLYSGDAQSKFSSATQQQLKLSAQLSDQLHGEPIEEVGKAIKHCLARDPGWVKAAKGILVGLKYSDSAPLDPQIKAGREAFNAAVVNDYAKAVGYLEAAANASPDSITKGWMKAQLAEYLHFIDPVESQTALKSAIGHNPRVTHPLAGIMYQKLIASNINQSQQCLNVLNERFADGNRLIIAINALLDDLVFKPETASVFEESMKQLALLVGFHAQRPETDFGKGPDVLWEVGELRYFVIECKNGAVTDTIIKYNCNQLNGSMNWFEERYDASCRATAIMVHPVNTFEFACSPHDSTRIMTTEKLDELKLAVRGFFETVAQSQQRSVQSIATLLKYYQLTQAQFVSRYTVGFRVTKK